MSQKTKLWVPFLSIHQSVFLLLSVATGSVGRTFFGTWLPLPALTPARPMSRACWIRFRRYGRVERSVRESWKRPSGRPTLLTLFFFSDPFWLPTSSGEIGTSLLSCASRRSPPELLFTNHIKGVVPTLASTSS